MLDASFFTALALLIFLGILGYAGVHKFILSGLDARGAKVAAQLGEAERLRNEAAALLKSYEDKRKAAEKEAADLVEAARAEAKRVEAEAKAKLEDFVKRRTAQAELKIAQAEQQAAADVRKAAAELAVKAAGTILAAAKGDDAFNEGLKQVKTQLN
ncbi:MAG: ATP F0F1 synthase subunit B [Methylobacterium sp.]|jgi:F-type H+-transporting ATPase subunit b|nr:ATP F0F1 synthase subunit B [Methylobacterium sp.]